MARQLDDKNQSEKRPVSIRKVEANRRNAMKSTAQGQSLARRSVEGTRSNTVCLPDILWISVRTWRIRLSMRNY
jgi:hypothetical protein